MQTDEEMTIQEMLRERCRRLNKNFVWTPEKKQKIIELNSGLLERYRDAYNEMVRIATEYEERFRSGDNNYKDYTIELEFWYSAGESENEEENELWGNMCEETVDWGPMFSIFSSDRGKEGFIKPFEEVMLIDRDYNANREPPFNRHEFPDTSLYCFMHEIFDHNGTYSLEDAIRMKAENFSWQLVIHLEHWGKSCQ